MANMKELLGKADYIVKTVGPSRDWEFSGDRGTVQMATDSLQLEGHEQYWIDLNRRRDSAAPSVGSMIAGHIEQDEAGKYPPKFVKEKTGGSWGGGGGGGRTSPGAIWSSAVETASIIVAGYYSASGTKPKNMVEYLGKIELVAPKVNVLIDKLVASNPSKVVDTTDKTESESGESPAPDTKSKEADVIIEDISDEDLGDW